MEMRARKNDLRTLAKHATVLLQGHPWFRTASAQDVADCIESGRAARFDSKQFVLRIDEMHDKVILILSGLLATTALNESGHRYVSSLLSKGDLTNFIPVLDQGVVIHDFLAKTDVELFFINGSVFRAFTASNNHIRGELIAYFCNRARRYQRDIHQFSLSSLESRCAQALLHLGDNWSSLEDSADEGVLQINQAELGDMLGYSRQSINKALAELRQHGAIAKIATGKYRIADRVKLEAISSKRQK